MIRYSGIPDSTKKAYAFVASMSVELSQWRNALPSKLRVTDPQPEKTCYLPAVLELKYVILSLHTPLFWFGVASNKSGWIVYNFTALSYFSTDRSYSKQPLRTVHHHHR
jgi:hypothetical protein